ncbi:MADS-box protein SVP [Vitis vinifera]|uniref:MADS-box protein SVP n=1 Tax=Vitis vinifera TaxID=29760 RepID=A0A438IQP3_VITVI|nr:MADS-box protein SVP [Vitis vinifera]
MEEEGYDISHQSPLTRKHCSPSVVRLGAERPSRIGLGHFELCKEQDSSGEIISLPGFEIHHGSNYLTNGRPFSQSLSVSQVIERHNQHPQTPEKPEPPSLELQLENSTCAALSKEIVQQTQRLRQMKGEELQGLKIEELIELEELLEAGLCSVVEEKAERIRTEISDLQRKVKNLTFKFSKAFHMQIFRVKEKTKENGD